MFEAGEFDEATLFFGKFKNVVSQIPTAQQIIPAAAPPSRRLSPHPEGAKRVTKDEATGLLRVRRGRI